MSASFRPVKMIWGEASSQFLDREVLIGLIADISARSDSQWNEEEYSDTTEVWIEKGKAFLDYVLKDKRFTSDSLSESLEENGFEFDNDSLKSLISNIKSFASSWRSSISPDGALHFFID